MDFQTGDRVVHCTYGLGQVLALEERTINNRTAPYYMVQVDDLTIWVPANENVNNRLRFPSSQADFTGLIAILSGPADQLPADHRERTLLLSEMLKDGRAETLFKVIRNLSAYRHSGTWNEYDSALMKRVQKALIGEWCFVFSVTPKDAEIELQRLLAQQEK